VDDVIEVHVREAHAVLTARRIDLVALRSALTDLLEYLSGEGRTEANCRTVDAFFCLLTAEHADLLDRLPGGWQELVDDVGLDLAATFEDPERADRAGASPERLLERLRALGTGHSVTM
jgi:hypothetical protein